MHACAAVSRRRSPRPAPADRTARLTGLAIAAACSIGPPLPLFAVLPEHSVCEGGVRLQGVGPRNPIVYDNDWWSDVFDDNYLWAQASLGRADLRANIVTRDMWDWRNGYLYRMEQSVDDARKALRLARASGLENIPDLTLGSDRVLVRPASGRIEDTEAHPSDGSRRIAIEARKASHEEPLLVIAGGPLTTVANALLSGPEIAPNIVVFGISVSSSGYNGKDGWSVYIVAKKARLVEWATGAFWERNSVFQAKDFAGLPRNPFCDDMRRLIESNLGQANQLGDGAPLVWLWRHDCWRGARPRRAQWRGEAPVFVETKPGEAADVLDIPKAATDLEACREEFFRVLGDPAVYEPTPRLPDAAAEGKIRVRGKEVGE